MAQRCVRDPFPLVVHAQPAGRGFFHLVDLVDGHLYERLHDPAGPADLDAIHLFSLAQAEVHPQIVLRKIAAAAAHLLDLH